MKIKTKHYQILKQGINKILDKQPNIVSQAKESMRLRWDIYWQSGVFFSNAKEYQYLDDNNIDTALRNILEEYENSI